MAKSPAETLRSLPPYALRNGPASVRLGTITHTKLVMWLKTESVC